MANKKMTDCGYANEWGKDTPEIVAKCEHVGYGKHLDNALNEYGCEICGFSYLVDSSD